MVSWPEQPGFQLFTSVYGDEGVIVFGVTGGELSASYEDASMSETVVGVGPYDGTTQRWLQMRFSDGTMYFETSADGATWDEFAQDVLPFGVAAVTPTISGGNYSDGQNEVVIVDAFEMCAL